MSPIAPPTRNTPAGAVPLIEFCGEYTPVARIPFTIGRDADLVVEDDNRFLHRRLLAVERRRDLYVLVNVGRQLTVTVCDPGRSMEAQLGPGGVLPLVFGVTVVRFTAGHTAYELTVHLPAAPLAAEPPGPVMTGGHGDPTVRRAPLTPEQLLVLVVLAEPVLRGGAWAGAGLPSNAAAAARLGWTITKFNRKLDNLCHKFEARGVRGLHGGTGRLASYRRARLVEYVTTAGLVTRADLDLLP